MKIHIIRNAKIEKNAGLTRALDAASENHEVVLITRNREQVSKHKVQVKTINYNSQTFENYEIGQGTEMGRGIKNLLDLFTYQFTLFKTLVKHRKDIDVIHSFDLDAGLPTALFSKFYKKKHIYQIADFYVESRGGIPKSAQNLIKKLEYKVINSADCTIICTEHRINQIEGSKPKQLKVIHNTPVLFPIVKEENLKTSMQLKICYIGTLSEKRFLKEIVETVKNNSNIHLTIGGLGPLEEWIKRETQNIENVTFLGEVKYEDTLYYYNSCDLMVAIYNPDIKNHKYSAPNKVYEAMYLGKPIVVAKNTGLDELIESKDIGFSIEYSKEKFENLLNKLYIERGILEEKGTNSAKNYKTFSWEEMKKRLNEVYISIETDLKV